MYIIHSKAKLIVIEIINPITRKAKIFNIASPPHSRENSRKKATHTSASYLLSMQLLYYKNSFVSIVIYWFFYFLPLFLNNLIASKSIPKNDKIIIPATNLKWEVSPVFGVSIGAFSNSKL